MLLDMIWSADTLLSLSKNASLAEPETRLQVGQHHMPDLRNRL